MSRPPKLVLQHRRLEPLPLALLADRGDAGHHRQVGVDDAGAVAGGAGALGVGAEQRRLHAVGLRERLADRVEQSGVRRRVAPPRAADRASGRPTPPRRRPDTEPWISELLPEPATPVTTTSTPSGMSTSTSCRLCGCRAAHLQRARRRPHRRLEGGPVVEVAAGDGAAGPQPLDGALEDHLAARRAGAGAEVDDVVGDRDRLRLVLHDEHRVALVPQPQQQVVHPLDVVGVQARWWARRRRR